MGGAVSKRRAALRGESRVLRAKIYALEEEMRETRRKREEEARARERREAAFAAKEDEWKRERRRHREEVGALKKQLEDEACTLAPEGEYSAAEPTAVGGDGVNRELRYLSACRLVEQMKEEQARREQAVERWKQLYLAIKAELDALITRTKQGEGLGWVAEENAVGRLLAELKAKEDTIEALRSRLAATEMEGAKREREVDILRQSHRILSSKKSSLVRKNLVRSLRPREERRRRLQTAQDAGTSFHV